MYLKVMGLHPTDPPTPTHPVQKCNFINVHVSKGEQVKHKNTLFLIFIKLKSEELLVN